MSAQEITVFLFQMVVIFWLCGRLMPHLHTFRDLYLIIRKKSLLCGNTKCMVMARNLPCVHAERLIVQDLADGTPIEKWAREHVLGKILSAHEYELQLQIAMQLAALYKYGGILSSPGVIFPPHRQTEWVTGVDCQATISDIGLLSASLTEAKSLLLLERFATAYSASREWPVTVDWNRQVFAPILECALYHDTWIHQVPTLVSQGWRYGALSYGIRRQDKSLAGRYPVNLGRDMQGLAALQFLPCMNALVERDSLDLVYLTQDLETPASVQTLVFLNAAFGNSTRVWPPPEFINPVLVGLETETNEGTIDTFDMGMEWLRKQWPVGVRDAPTLKYFNGNGNRVSAFITDCMTLTIRPLCPIRQYRRRIMLVDAGKKADDCAQAPLDENLTFISDKSSEPIDSVDVIARYRKAFQLLRAYDCESREAIDTQIQAALPRKEFETPVVSLEDDKSSLRGAHHRAAEQKKLTRNRLLVLAFCHDDAIADAAIKFGTIQPSWARHLRRPYQCSNEKGNTTNCIDSRHGYSEASDRVANVC